jgi:6-phospho-beta-glucosidase
MVRAILGGETSVQYDQIVLYDTDESRLARIGAVIAGMGAPTASAVDLILTTQLDRALDGADVIYCAIRVGGVPGRVVDETIAIEAGAIGQETAGAGGIGYALRTVPVMTRIALEVQRLAPQAMFINFTNPVGLVTEALQRILGDRVIGICDTPAELCRRAAEAAGYQADRVWFDYFGINHLGWLKGMRVGNRDVLPELIQDTQRLLSFEEGRLFGPEWIASNGMIPNEYLYYYYFQKEALAGMRSGTPRSLYLEQTQGEFYRADGDPEDALAAWEATLAEREANYMAEAWDGREDDQEKVVAARHAGGYGRLALGVVDALNSDGNQIMILDVPNRSALPFLDEDAIVEVSCVVNRGGVTPTAVGSVPMFAQGLIQQVRGAERVAIDAALSGSRTQAVRALALHPLVPSVSIAERIFDGYLHGQPSLREIFT